MTFLNENFGKELQRMSELAGIPNKNINENLSKEPSTRPSEDEETIEEDGEACKVLKENDDLFGDIGDIFNQQNNALQSKPVTGDLNKDLKAAMVLNNVGEYEAALLNLYTTYNPKTLGAKPEDMGGDAGTIITKRSVEKFPGISKDLDRMKSPNQGLDSDNNKLTHRPVSWDEKDSLRNDNVPIKASLAKWQPLQKDESIISYEKNVDKFGHETFTLSNRGKQQLEYLQRMYSQRPLSPNGDPNVDIESALLANGFIYKNLVVTNAEKIIRDFFNKAVVPIIAGSLKRTSAAPKDSQFERFVRVGVDHAIDQTKQGKYNSDKYNNYGAWFMQVVKNKVIDQLKSQTTFKLDTTNVYDMLSNMPGPLKIDSQLNPDEATGNYDGVTQSKSTFTKDGSEKNYFTYIYNKPENALADLEAKAVKTDTGFKKSPLRAAYLKEPGMFYKSYMEHIPAELSQATVEPAYFEKYQDVPAKVLLKIAKKEDSILEQIAKEIVVSTAKVGEKVKLSGRENAKYPTLTKGKTYQVSDKGEDPVAGGGKPKKYYIVTDDKGEQIKVSARALTPTETVEGKIVSKARENELAVIELLKLLLQYGRMKAVYTKTVYLPKSEGGWVTKNVGEAVAKDKSGKIILPYASPKDGSRFKDLENAPIEYIWSSEKYSEDVNDKLIDDLSNVAKAKGLTLPSQYFNSNNEPLYKLKGSSADTKQKTVEFVNGIRNALRRFFGFTTLENPIIKQNRDILKRLLDNLSKSQEAASKNIAENKLRQIVKELISEKIK